MLHIFPAFVLYFHLCVCFHVFVYLSVDLVGDFWAASVTSQSHLPDIFLVSVFAFSLVCLCLGICVCVFVGCSGRGLLGSWCY